MGSTIDEFSLEHFHLRVPELEKPETFFNTLPYHAGAQEIDCSGTVNQIVEEWKAATGQDVSKTLDDIACRFPLYLAPQCPPRLVYPFVKFACCAFFWDDATDALDEATHENIRLDLRTAILSEVKLGRHTACEFKLNELYAQSLLDLVVEVQIESGALARPLLEVFESALQAQAAPKLCTVTWESYKEHRIRSFGDGAISRLIPTINSIRVSNEEADSVSEILQAGYLAAGLTNDYHSFNKEFDEHFSVGSLDVMHNGMAVLMSNYSYSEDEARDILKQEVLTAEQKLMADYEAWSASPAQKSGELRRYMLTSILTIGGMNYWQAISPRYHRASFRATAAERAELVGRHHDGKLRLNSYPPPAMAAIHYSLPDTAEERASAGIPLEDMTAPFEKAPAKEIVLAPWEYIRSLPGKRTLGRVIECLQTWFKLPDTSATIINEITRMMFDATLMLDDMQDGSHLRRGRPAAHTIFGQPQTINSATYLYVRGGRQLNGLKHVTQCRGVYYDELETLAFGQGLELNWRYHTTLPSIKEYLVMVDHKTGGFFRLVVRLLEVESETEPNPDLMHLFTLLGRYYQIRDDYMNLVSDEYTAKKGFCDDLSEGKFSFPLIHLLQNGASPEQTRGLLFNRDRSAGTDLSVEAKQFVLDAMKGTGSLDYTKQVLDGLFDVILQTLDSLEARLGPNKKLRILALWLKI